MWGYPVLLFPPPFFFPITRAVKAIDIQIVSTFPFFPDRGELDTVKIEMFVALPFFLGMCFSHRRKKR